MASLQERSVLTVECLKDNTLIQINNPETEIWTETLDADLTFIEEQFADYGKKHLAFWPIASVILALGFIF